MKNYLQVSGCPCGRSHDVAIDEVVVGSGVIRRIPDFVSKYHCVRPFILADVNTFAAAGDQVCAVLEEASIPYSRYIFPQNTLEPDEHAVGAAVMHFDPKCDLIIGVGSGVINDIGKILSNISGRKYIIVGTAPSMDGYASTGAAMILGGMKVTVSAGVPAAILADTDVLKNAPMDMIKSGYGDIIGKYSCLNDWKLANIVNSEYFAIFHRCPSAHSHPYSRRK